MPTVALRLIEGGKQFGLTEGGARGRIAAITRVLSARFETLDAATTAQLEALPVAMRDIVLDRAVSASSLDAVFAPN
jgi:hypothetical protein